VWPDIQFEAKALVAEGDRVALHWMFAGTHLGTVYLEGGGG
jgi:predicted ester cyclase